MQHDAFTWEADLTARDFVAIESPSAGALYARDVVASWLARYTDAELSLFVETLFSALRRMAGSDNLADVFAEGKNPVAVLTQAAREADGEGRALAMRMMGELTADAAKTAAASVADAVQSAVEGRTQAATARPEARGPEGHAGA